MNFDDLLRQAESHRQIAYAAFEKKDFATAQRAYGQALALYDQLPEPAYAQTQLFYTLRAVAQCAMHEADYEAAYHHYLRLFNFTHTHETREQKKETLEGLIDACVRIKDRDKGVVYLRSIAQQPTNTHILCQLAQGAAQIQQFPLAQEFLARALKMSGKRESAQSEALWTWGKIEYDLDHKQLGCHLCRMALLRDQKRADAIRAKFAAKKPNADLTKFRKLLELDSIGPEKFARESEFKMMDCDHDQ